MAAEKHFRGFLLDAAKVIKGTIENFTELRWLQACGKCMWDMWKFTAAEHRIVNNSCASSERMAMYGADALEQQRGTRP